MADSTALTVLVVVVFIFVLFVGANVGLWYYAQQNALPGKKKTVSKKKIKREALRRGLQPAGD